jgi:hypothetical protein
VGRENIACKISIKTKLSAGGGTQVVEHLHYKHEVLSSDPNTAKKKSQYYSLTLSLKTICRKLL